MAPGMVIEAKTPDVLVLSPHPDDAEFGMGGTMLLLASGGYTVRVLVLTRGEGSARSTVEQRTSEQLRAAKMGGYTTSFLELPDGAVQATPETVGLCRQIILTTEPKLLFAPSALPPSNVERDWKTHADHLATGMIAEQAIRSIGRRHDTPAHGRTPCLLSYYAPREVKPVIIVDIGPVLGPLEDLLRCFSTQLGVAGRNITELLMERRESRSKMYPGARERFHAHNDVNMRSARGVLEGWLDVDLGAS